MFLPTTHRRMKAKEYFEMPQGPPYFQLVHGELFMSPSPNRQHQEILGNIFARIKEYLRKRPSGWICMAPSDVQLDDDNIFQPDIYCVSRERAAILNDQGTFGAPDLVVEILSPSTSQLDRQPKRGIYQRAGVSEQWFINARAGRVENYLAGAEGDLEQPARVLCAGERMSTSLLPGWEMEVGEMLGS